MKLFFQSFTIVYLLFVSSTVFSQSEFSYVFEDENKDPSGHYVVETYLNTYIIAGENSGDIILFHIDTSGNIIWQKAYKRNASKYSKYHVLCATKDSCFVAAYNISSGTVPKYLLLIKFDINGNTIWTSTVRCTCGHPMDIVETWDKGLVISTNSSIIVKVDFVGNLQWSRRYYKYNHSFNSYSIIESKDSNLIMCGGTDKLVLAKLLTYNGDIIWLKEFTDNMGRSIPAKDMCSLSDYVYTISSVGNTSEKEYIISKFDPEGNLLNAKNLILHNPLTYFYSIKNNAITRTRDGYLASLFPNNVIKFDSSLNIIWSKSFDAELANIYACIDTGLVIVGNGPVGGVDFWDHEIQISKGSADGESFPCAGDYSLVQSSLILLNDTLISPYMENTGQSYVVSPEVSESNIYKTTHSCVSWISGEKDHREPHNLTIFPNPSSGLISIKNPENIQINKVYLYMPQGQLINCIIPGSDSESIDLSFLSNGIYYIRIISDSGTFTRKIVIYK